MVRQNTHRARKEAALRRNRRRRRRTGALVLALVTAVVVAALVAIARSGDGDGDGGAASGDEPRETAAPISDPPARYRIVYRLDETGSERTTTEEAIVDRPYRSRRTLWNGGDTTAEPARVSVSGFGFLSVRSQNAADFTATTSISPATGDLRLENALAELVEAGRVDRRGDDQVLDTACTIYRVREPIGTGEVLPATAEEWTDVCVDERGLVLREEWTLDRKLFQVKEAIEVDIDPAVDDALFAPFSEPVAAGAGGGGVRPVDASSRPSFIFWELDEAPAGFTHRGRYEVLLPSNRADAADPSQPAPPTSEVVDVYERGADFIVISRGSFVGREAEFEPRQHGTRVPLGELGTAETEDGVYGNWLRVKTDAVQFLSIRGTVATDELVEIARRLRPGERGRLVYLDGSS